MYLNPMTTDYSVDICKILEKRHQECHLHRPMKVDRYDTGDHLTYRVLPLENGIAATVSLTIKEFVGGGFAGQVYKVEILEIEDGEAEGLKAGGIYALKILVPSSGVSRVFRNVLYAIGFQAPFQLQVNPSAARSGAIWQKFIRRAASLRFGDENVVNDIHATLIDQNLGSCGELSDWVEGRTWRLEVDEYLDILSGWSKDKEVCQERLGSPEYRAKNKFMHEFVDMLHEIGAHELARQYEWSTAKSQPNCLKRLDTEDDPESGLIAVDFRAGLTLLPFLPMSPGDFKLIGQGLMRGSLVQLDRGNLKTLESYVENRKEYFIDLLPLLAELKKTEEIYRNSIPDITHNHVRLLYSKKLWSTMLKSAVTGWRTQNLIDEKRQQSLSNSVMLTLLFCLLGLFPFIGRFIRKLWANPDWRKHYLSALLNPRYFWRALKGKVAENLIGWVREGRISDPKVLRISRSPLRYYFQLPLAILPVGVHKALTDFSFLKERLSYYLIRPIRLYFNADLREEWLREMVADGERKKIISQKDRDIILSQINEPFIQKYLKSLAVHICTAPITQIVSITVALIYVYTHPELSRSQAWGIGIGIVALFQVVPVSPGSLVRGFYVLYLVIKEKNFKDYNIAVFLGFFKYIGYLAFPIQMTYRYPVLARFMAGHWATDAVHIVPVFGESGALLERWVFCLFYNWPLTIARRIRTRLERRKMQAARYWHILLATFGASISFLGIEHVIIQQTGTIPGLWEVWWAVFLIPFFTGSFITLFGGGLTLWGRIKGTVFFSVTTAVAVSSAALFIPAIPNDIISIVTAGFWRMFLFSVFSVIGLIMTELLIPDPDMIKRAE